MEFPIRASAVENALWELVADGDSVLYTNNHGAGMVGWKAGCFISGTMEAADLYEMQQRIPSGLVSDEWWEFLFDAVAECDMLIFKTFNTKGE